MKLKHLAAAALAAAAVPSAADASVVVSGIAGQPGFLTGTISYSPASLNLNVGVGRIQLTGTEQPSGDAVSILAYCVDILHFIHTGTFEVTTASTLIADPAKQAQLLTLLSNADPLIAAATTSTAKKNISAAIQLAAWEIVYESNANGYSLDGGLFSASGSGISAAETLAGTYLGNVTGGTWTPVDGYRTQLLYSADNQSQLFLSAVPEPATWAMMIGGFGLVGGAMRSRRRQRTAVLA